jgi:hypothetical protein
MSKNHLLEEGLEDYNQFIFTNHHNEENRNKPFVRFGPCRLHQ